MKYCLFKLLLMHHNIITSCTHTTLTCYRIYSKALLGSQATNRSIGLLRLPPLIAQRFNICAESDMVHINNDSLMVEVIYPRLDHFTDDDMEKIQSDIMIKATRFDFPIVWIFSPEEVIIKLIGLFGEQLYRHNPAVIASPIFWYELYLDSFGVARLRHLPKFEMTPVREILGN